MIERITAETQRNLSYLIFAIFFVLKILEGLKWIGAVTDMGELLMLVAAYWFMRSRPAEKPNA